MGNKFIRVRKNSFYRDAQSLVPYLKKMYHSDVEHQYLIGLGFWDEERGYEIVFIKDISYNQREDGVEFFTRDVFKYLFQVNCTGFILVHNHPRWTPVPSATDLETAKELMCLGEELDCTLLDEIIVSCNTYFSCNETDAFTYIENCDDFKEFSDEFSKDYDENLINHILRCAQVPGIGYFKKPLLEDKKGLAKFKRMIKALLKSIEEGNFNFSEGK